ncbi:MAG TPA: 50S ribosomal protein L15 [Smithellaceae bacterium]|jgi:large subunit ribosomal protein L15|nr:50S ribosomal protein L15 [Smithellaceae bacterium]HNT90338.1 50S ribosomal protein L15 [Smithellaceae bacterium]HNV63877.1 50S ribosomal protein L15 [Smithellaceae bacterium]HNZ31130.1 50S ribosomal protein L15 [Smithellaceae bacterium]HOD30194.1 50S ribosomal protein L15 [Smithellaceae bacterium]
MDLSSLQAPAGAIKKRKRVGRGESSGWGKTAGRGNKGQRARSGGKIRAGFEGGQMPLSRRLPKRGFRNPFREKYIAVNITDICRKFSRGAVIDEKTLLASGLLKKKGEKVKILAKGDIDFPVTVKLAKISQAAKEKITAAGGSVEEVI